MRECIVSAWNELAQRVTDASVTQWRIYLHASVKVKRWLLWTQSAL